MTDRNYDPGNRQGRIRNGLGVSKERAEWEMLSKELFSAENRPNGTPIDLRRFFKLYKEDGQTLREERGIRDLEPANDVTLTMPAFLRVCSRGPVSGNTSKFGRGWVYGSTAAALLALIAFVTSTPNKDAENASAPVNLDLEGEAATFFSSEAVVAAHKELEAARSRLSYKGVWNAKAAELDVSRLEAKVLLVEGRTTLALGRLQEVANVSETLIGNSARENPELVALAAKAWFDIGVGYRILGNKGLMSSAFDRSKANFSRLVEACIDEGSQLDDPKDRQEYVGSVIANLDEIQHESERLTSESDPLGLAAVRDQLEALLKSPPTEEDKARATRVLDDYRKAAEAYKKSKGR